MTDPDKETPEERRFREAKEARNDATFATILKDGQAALDKHDPHKIIEQETRRP